MTTGGLIDNDFLQVSSQAWGVKKTRDSHQ